MMTVKCLRRGGKLIFVDVEWMQCIRWEPWSEYLWMLKSTWGALPSVETDRQDIWKSSSTSSLSSTEGALRLPTIDLGDGQFSERCNVDGSFFNSDAIPIIFWKDLISPSLRLFFLTIGNDYFSITLLILRTDYFAIIHDMPDLPDPAREKKFFTKFCC